MKEFLALYMGTAESLDKWKSMSEAAGKQQKKAGAEAWLKWTKINEDAIVDPGTPIGKTKRVTAQGISETSNQISAYTIVEADSHEAAARLFQNHPHFMMFPGECIEVMECLPMPKI